MILGHFSLAHVSLDARIAAAAEAGFEGISLSWRELKEEREKNGDLSHVTRLLNHHELYVAQIEHITLPSWEGRQAFAAEAESLIKTAASLNCGIVHATALDCKASNEDLVHSLRQLAELCGGFSVKCAVEFIPHISLIPDLKSAVNLLDEVNNPSAGLVIDTFHFYRSAPDWDLLDEIPGSRIFSVQINDGPLRPLDLDYVEETMNYRKLPGEGEFDLARFLGVISRKAEIPSLTVEVIDRHLSKKSLNIAASMLYKSAHKLTKNTN